MYRIKNSHASISQALKLIKTKRRIVLTGYPLQVNIIAPFIIITTIITTIIITTIITTIIIALIITTTMGG